MDEYSPTQIKPASTAPEWTPRSGLSLPPSVGPYVHEVMGMFIVHTRSGQGIGVPWVQSCSSSTHDPIDTIANFVVDMGTAVAEAVAEEVSVDAAVDSARPG